MSTEPNTISELLGELDNDFMDEKESEELWLQKKCQLRPTP